MSSSCRFALSLALALATATAVLAQSSPASSNPSAPVLQAQAASPAAQPGMSVQARIKARREQRRAAAIHDAYDHLYEVYTGGGYLRFTAGSIQPRSTEAAWDEGFTRFFGQRLGVTVDGRGYYSHAYVFNVAQKYGLTNDNPGISQYTVMAGPTYRFYLQPKYSLSLRALAGLDQGRFSGETNGTANAQALGLWKDGPALGANASFIYDYNLTPHVGLRVAPEYFMTGFGSKEQNNLGFTLGVVYRFGKL